MRYSFYFAAMATSLGAMPPAVPALPVVTSVSPSSAAALPVPSSAATAVAAGGTAPTSAWVTMLDAMSGGTAASQKLSGERVFIGNGLPTVPKATVERIYKWQYVDLADLLPAPSLHDQSAEPGTRFSLFPGFELVRPKKRQIETIVEWTKAFTVLTAVVASREPAQVAELLAYQLTIIKASQSFDGLQWRAYNTHFRVAAAATGNKTWSKLDVDLYTRVFTGRAKLVHCCSVCDSTTHSAANCPSSAARRSEIKGDSKSSASFPPKRHRAWSDDTCHLFNASNCPFGQKYKFKHTCGDYGGAHSAKVCSFTPKPHGSHSGVQ